MKPDTISAKDLLTVPEVASLLQVDPDKIYEMVRAGKIPFRAIGNKLRFPGWLLVDWMRG